MADLASVVQLNQPGAEGRTAALVEIHALLNRYAYVARDHLDWDRLGRMFRVDAKVHLANGRIIPHVEMKQLMPRDNPKYMRHHITAIDVQFQSHQEATACVQWFASTDLSARDHWGEWEDTILWDSDAGWLIAEKRIKFEGLDPKGVAASMAADVESSNA